MCFRLLGARYVRFFEKQTKFPQSLSQPPPVLTFLRIPGAAGFFPYHRRKSTILSQEASERRNPNVSPLVALRNVRYLQIACTRAVQVHLSVPGSSLGTSLVDQTPTITIHNGEFGDSYLLYRLHGYSALCHCIPVQISDVRILKNPPLCITVVGTGCTSRSPVVVLSITDTYVGHVGGCFEI